MPLNLRLNININKLKRAKPRPKDAQLVVLNKGLNKDYF